MLTDPVPSWWCPLVGNSRTLHLESARTGLESARTGLESARTGITQKYLPSLTPFAGGTRCLMHSSKAPAWHQLPEALSRRPLRQCGQCVLHTHDPAGSSPLWHTHRHTCAFQSHTHPATHTPPHTHPTTHTLPATHAPPQVPAQEPHGPHGRAVELHRHATLRPAEDLAQLQGRQLVPCELQGLARPARGVTQGVTCAMHSHTGSLKA